MSLRKFLWCLSLSVFLAGLVYRYAGPFGLFKAHGVATSVYAAPLFDGSHRPNDHIVSPIVGRSSTFWYLTAADRAVSNGLILGSGLVSLTTVGRAPWPFRSEIPTLAGHSASSDAPPDGQDFQGALEAPAPAVR